MMYYANKENKYFTRKEALEHIKDTLENGFDGYYCDLHHETFNTDYYIMSKQEAKTALEEYDIFKAIGVVVSYEKENFGEIYTDISNPEKIANMLWYIIGEEAIAELESVTGDNWNDAATDGQNAEILAEINEIM